MTELTAVATIFFMSKNHNPNPDYPNCADIREDGSIRLFTVETSEHQPLFEFIDEEYNSKYKHSIFVNRFKTNPKPSQPL